jgi:hypothetical protein
MPHWLNWLRWFDWYQYDPRITYRLPDWYDPQWLLPLVLVGVPLLAGACFRLYGKPLRYVDRMNPHPTRTLVVQVGAGGVLLLGAGLCVSNPHPLTLLVCAPILFATVCYLQGRVRPLGGNRAVSTNIGASSLIVLASGILLWGSAIYLAARMPAIVAPHPEEFFHRFGGLVQAVIWSGVFVGIGAHLRRTWWRTLAQRKP